MSDNKKVYKVLIIDDAFFIRNLIKRAVVTKPEDDVYGYKFDVIGEAINGREGIVQYFKMNPDLITLDINMPDINGVEVTKQILSKDPNAKIIVISGNLDEKIREDILNAGALEYIQKPFQNTYLWEKLDKVAKMLIEGNNTSKEKVDSTIVVKEEIEETKIEDIKVEISSKEIKIENFAKDVPLKVEIEEEVKIVNVNKEHPVIVSIDNNSEDDLLSKSSISTIEKNTQEDKDKDKDEDEDDDLLSIKPRNQEQERIISIQKSNEEDDITENQKKSETLEVVKNDISIPSDNLNSIKFGNKQHKKEKNDLKESKRKDKKDFTPSPIEVVTPVFCEEKNKSKNEGKTKHFNTQEDEIHFNFEVEFDIDKELPSKETLLIKNDDFKILLPEEDKKNDNVEEVINEKDEEVVIVPTNNPIIIEPKTSPHEEVIIVINNQNNTCSEESQDDEVVISIGGSLKETNTINTDTEFDIGKTSNDELKNNNVKYNTVSIKVDNSDKEDEGNKGLNIAPPRSKALRDMYADVVHTQYKTTYPDEPTEPEVEEVPKKEGLLSSLKKLFNKK